MLNYLFPNRLKNNEPKQISGFRVNWKKTECEALKIIYQGAIERVQDTVKDHQEISRKYFSLLIIFLSISSALCAFLFNENQSIFKLKVIAFIAVIACCFIILIIGQMIRPITFMPPGRVPYKAITKDTFENPEISEKDLQKYIIYQELLVCQAKIDMNQYYNTKRLSAMDFIIRFTMICFIVLTILLLIINTPN